MSKVKLSPKQKEIVLAIRAGVALKKVFYPKATRYELNGRNQNWSVIQSLVSKDIIEVGDVVFSGITKHYYKLTALGQSIEL